MCAGAFYWSGLGRVVFALSNEQLRAVAPAGSAQLNLSAAAVFAHGRRQVCVVGPIAAVAAEAQSVVDGVRSQTAPTRTPAGGSAHSD